MTREVLCHKCGDAGWLWVHELDSYRPDPHDCYSDDTRYTCDRCRGGILLDDYQREALKTGDNMLLDKYQADAQSTAIYPGALMYPTLGLCGEVGEFTESIVFPCALTSPTKEAGDVLWYIANVAYDAGLPLSAVTEVDSFEDIPFVGYCGCEDALCCDLTIFAGRVAENVKKAFRDNAGELTEVRLENIRKALKSLLFGLAKMVDLEVCAQMNLDKLFDRKERGVLGGDGNDR